jgi:outer membrane receptor for ferrienterochelin and colicins
MPKFKSKSGAALVFACSIWCANSSLAQLRQPDLSQMGLEDLIKVQVDAVSGASKFLEKSTDVPASVTIVTADEIREFGYRTLADALQSVRGFNVIYDRNYSYVGIRGFLQPGDYNARILFLLDGHRVNDNIYDGAYVGTAFPVDIELIDRIEIVRGASSSVYGAGALLAVINVITKRGRDLDGAEASAMTGSLRSYKAQGMYGARFDNGLEMLLSGTVYRSRGNASLFFPEFDSPQTNFGFAENADQDRASSVFADVIFRDFSIHVVDNSRTKQIPTASFGTVFNDPRTQTTDAHGYVDVQYSHTLGEWDFIGRASYDWYRYHGVYIYDYANLGVPPFTENEDLAIGNWSDFEFDASRRLLQRHHITLGAEYRQDFLQQQINYDLRPYAPYLDEEHPAEAFGVYAQDDFRLRTNLSLVAGARLDWHSTLANNVSPRLGVLYSPAESTHFKLMYGQAFRVPNSYESYYVSSISNTASATLKAEDVHTLELEFEGQFGKGYDFITSLYANRFHDLINQQSNPAIGRLPNTNSSEVLHSNGLEVELKANWPRGVKGQVSYSLQSSRYFPGGEMATNSPAQLAKARLLVPIVQKRFSASLDGWYTDHLLSVSGIELGSYFVGNATLLAPDVHKNFDISVSVYNLLNKRYAEPGGFEHRQASIPQDGRTAEVQLTYRFASRTQ